MRMTGWMLLTMEQVISLPAYLLVLLQEVLVLNDAFKIAADYTAKTIETTLENPAKPWYGVDFEATIPELVDTLRQYV